MHFIVRVVWILYTSFTDRFLLKGRIDKYFRKTANIWRVAILKWTVRKLGKSPVLGPDILVTGGPYVTIGDNLFAMGRLYLYGADGEIRIGNDCSINTNVVVGGSGGLISIGNDVLIGPNVVLRTADHGTELGELMRKQRHKRGTIIIEDDVWIASNVVVTKDVKISVGSVIAAGAVVTRDTEPYSVNAGVPAKKIGTRKK